MGLFYTGRGDKGKSLIGKKKIDKTSPIIDALGELDELNSLIGLVKNYLFDKGILEILDQVQESLFIVQANVANLMMSERKYKPPHFSADKVKSTEDLINKFEDMVKPEKGFIVSGANRGSAWLDYVRTVSRRVERRVLVVHKKRNIDPDILAYLNRLSSLFFAMARMESKRKKSKEKHPSYK